MDLEGGKNGIFFVRSAYQLIHSHKLLHHGERSSSSRLLNPLGKAIWRMKLPNKIQIFAWRACLDSLPCFYNLFKRKVPVDSHCQFCGVSVEDLAHTLFYCPDLHEGWEQFLPFMREASPNLSFSELVLWVKNRSIATDLEAFFVVAWSLWGRQNKILYKQRNDSPKSVISGALAFTSLYSDCIKSSINDLRSLSKWLPPPPNYFKLNVDGALFFD